MLSTLEVIQNKRISETNHLITLAYDPEAIGSPKPGQSVQLLIPSVTPGESWHLRSYSVFDSIKQSLEVIVSRQPGGLASNYLCNLRQGGSLISVGFKGDLHLPEDGSLTIFTTGTGYVPIPSLLKTTKRTAPIVWHHGTRLPDADPLVSAIGRLREPSPELSLTFHVSKSNGLFPAFKEASSFYTASIGRITKSVIEIATFSKTEGHVLLVGNPTMIQTAKSVVSHNPNLRILQEPFNSGDQSWSTLEEADSELSADHSIDSSSVEDLLAGF